MNLLKIKKKSDELNISIRLISAKIGMSEQNLHKCIRDNRIEAGVLEKIAAVLDISVSYFFMLRPLIDHRQATYYYSYEAIPDISLI